MSDNGDLIKEFLIESYENLDRLDRDLLVLEKHPTESNTLSSVFRTIHTIKGTCGFLGFHKLESVSHVGENLLSKLREGQLVLDGDIANGLLGMVDAIRQILGNIEQTASEGERDFSELVDRLTELNARTGSATPAAVEAPKPEAKAPSTPPIHAETVEAKPGPEVVTAVAEPHAEAAVEPHAETFAEAHARDNESGTSSGKTAVSDTTIRVDVSLLDKLMNLVGELVLARNQVLQFTTSSANSSFVGTSQRLNLITTELQEGVMKTRMQPILNVWNKFPRVVRDLAQACGKSIRLDMEGEGTELDKTIIEAIKDPLTHVVRNSVDHGIETPEARKKAGKNEVGRLLLRAYHEGGQVNIEITDDGAGINVERVKKKALERGLITQEQAGRMADREAMHLIFLPGFSTAEKITNVSGRGVGMDVVKTNVEKIGGSVDIQSVQGKGTTLKIKIPLTLAIIPALVITSGGDRFAIPQVSLLELVRLEGEQAKKGVEMIHGSPVYRLRGNLLPLVRLNKTLELETTGHTAAVDILNIVVLQADERQFGLVVDEINDTEEIVVKPLGKQFKGNTAFAGATIMGDGRVALILDVMGLAQRASVISESRDRNRVDNDARGKNAEDGKSSLLLFRAFGGQRMAIPLAQVARLEEFPMDKIEQSSGQEVMQYRGQIMPLLRVGGHGSGEEGAENLHVVVYTNSGRSVGLVVDRILDIVEQAMVIHKNGSRASMVGSAIIQDKVTDVVNVAGLIEESGVQLIEAA